MSDRLIEDFVTELQSAGISIGKDVQGSTMTTYRVGGTLSYCVHIDSYETVGIVSRLIENNFVGQLNESNVVTIGKGSNILVSDEGFDGCVFIVDGELGEVLEIDELSDHEISVKVGAGMALPSFARQCVPNKISGLEFYVGIPGSVGGAVAMNAGGHGKQTSDVLISCEVLNLELGLIEKFSRDSCEFEYRRSRFRPTDIIFSAQFEGKPGDPNEIKKEIDSIVQWRREFQPGGRNVGSVFQNPEDISSGELIEKSKLKGVRIGKAHVSEKHANFIQADEGATAKDVAALIELVKSTVLESTGYELHTEVRYIGKYDNG